MYKDAGVMGGKIKSTLTTNPMMTSPAGLNPTTGMGMFQPTFHPGNIKRDFKLKVTKMVIESLTALY